MLSDLEKSLILLKNLWQTNFLTLKISLLRAPIKARDGNLKKKCKSADNVENYFCFGILKNRIFELDHQITARDSYYH